MKNQLLSYFLFIFIFLSLESNSQIYNNAQASLKMPGAAIVKLNEKRQTIDYVKLSSGSSISEKDNLSWLTAQVLKTEPEVSFQLSKKETDLRGNVHFRYKQYYKSLPVEYGVYYVHLLNGSVESANGEYYNHINISGTASITKDVAFAKAIAEVPSEKYKLDTKGGLSQMKDNGELLVLSTENGFVLAYKFDIYSLKPLKRVYVYIDANTGKKIKEVNRIMEADVPATAVTAYNGTVSMTTDNPVAGSYRLRASKGFGGIRTLNLNNSVNYNSSVNFTDADNVWNDNGIDKYAYDAHFGTEATYDWYLSRFGRNSYDNAGAVLKSYVHYDNGYVNAFWDGSAMTYGDGDGVTYFPLTSLDIVGHEITHGVTENTAALVYGGESGALNESFSDCFGVTIDYFKNPSTANFLMADQIEVNGTPFRNMGDPNQFNNPDTYGGTYWNAPNEVHNNSGVQNYWYYLICMGGSGVNDLGNAYAVNPIGLTDASAIAYRSLSVYLTPNSNYADARFYSIQSAIDLFGTCSPQVIEVVNAWYAVGVGGIFSNAVVAGFGAEQNYLCSVPATVNFTNNSFNASSYLWDFGDGATDTGINPSHTYTTAGTYTIALTAYGTSNCSGTDTKQITDYITVTTGGGPVSPSCMPATINTCCDIGITNVLFGLINHASGNAQEGFMDFTCGNSTTLVAGDPVPIDIETSPNYNENVKAWIDYNNDGSFNNTGEMIFISNSQLGHLSGIVNTSNSAILNTPLRMRVIDDDSGHTITDACYNPSYGQAEDYTIIFNANTLPPVADFSTNLATVSVGSPVSFTDLTQHAPTSWQWTFIGASQTTSTIQNPVVTYNSVGIYEVSLIATNSFGQDSITKTSYVNVVAIVNMCTGLNSTNVDNGLFYDSGGPANPYSSGEYCTFLIEPDCAQNITLSFIQFETDYFDDSFKVYDGADASAPLIGSFSGWALPSDVTANSGKMFIEWSSGFASFFNSGWQATWSTVINIPNAPVAAFTSGSFSPPLSYPVQFTDATTYNPNSWNWDFGDGTSSSAQNPIHSFNASGSHIVKLIVANCLTSDTISQTITVQSPPVFSLQPDSINVVLNCMDSITVPVTIYNTGMGDLVAGSNESGNGTLLDTAVLIIQELDPWGLNISSFLQSNYGITPTVINDGQIASTDFSLYDVILTVSNQSSAYYTEISKQVSKFESFVAAGGIVQYQVGNYKTIPDINLAGGARMSAGNVEQENMGLLQSHPILASTSNPLAAPSSYGINYFYFSVLPPGAIVITETKNSLVPTTIEYNYGKGKVIATGMLLEFLYNWGDPNTAQLLKNFTSYVFSKMSNHPNWISVSPNNTIIAPGDSAIINVTLYSTGMGNGTYTSSLILNTNDPLNPTVTIPVFMALNNLSAAFNVTGNMNAGKSLQFTPSNTNASSYHWNFGDGNSSNLQSPQHIYQSSGTYYASLIVSDGSCTDSIMETLVIGPVGINEIDIISPLSVFPNPFNQNLQLTYELSNSQMVSLKVLDLLGQSVQVFENETVQQPGKYSYVFNPIISGIYFVNFSINGRTSVYKVIKTP